MIGFTKYWFLGFRAGWYATSPVPASAWSARDNLAIAYYKGYAWAQNIRDNWLKGDR